MLIGWWEKSHKDLFLNVFGRLASFFVELFVFFEIKNNFRICCCELINSLVMGRFKWVAQYLMRRFESRHSTLFAYTRFWKTSSINRTTICKQNKLQPKPVETLLHLTLNQVSFATKGKTETFEKKTNLPRARQRNSLANINPRLSISLLSRLATRALGR